MSLLQELEEIQGFGTPDKAVKPEKTFQSKIPWQQITLSSERINEIALEAVNEWLAKQSKKAS
jgi:Uri superfamily endonuclease